MINAPIPGQSWTSEPGKYDWQKPPKHNDPADAMKAHIVKYNDPEVFDDLMFILETGYPLRALTETLTSIGVANGLHSIDVSLIISPVLYEYLKSVATAAGVDFVEGIYTNDAKGDKEKEKEKARLQKYISSLPKDKMDEGAELVEDIMGSMDSTAMPEELAMDAPEDLPVPEDASGVSIPPEAAPAVPPQATEQQGLMSRKVM
jgi:hypothetical protein